MGKLIRNGIEYGGGNGTDIFEVTQAEYDALVQAGTLVHNALYVISDAPNLNATASDIEYSSGVTVKQKIDSKADTSAIPTRADFIRYEDVTIGAVEFVNQYWLNPNATRPNVPSGYMYLSGYMKDYGSIQSGTSAVVNVGINGTYLFGVTGSKYTNVQVRYIYIKI